MNDKTARDKIVADLKKMREELSEKNIILEEQLRENREKTEQLRQKDLELIEMDRIAGIGTLASTVNPFATGIASGFAFPVFKAC